jgi:hypothetical protein
MPGGSVYKGYTVNKEHSTPVSRKDDTYITLEEQQKKTTKNLRTLRTTAGVGGYFTMFSVPRLYTGIW